MSNTAPVYEYDIIVMTGNSPNVEELLAQLNELGSQGWHMVSTGGGRYIFMERPRVDTPEG
jgi:hypothetical protein